MPRCRRTTSSARSRGAPARTRTPTPSRRWSTRATVRAAWRSSSRRSPTTATAPARRSAHVHEARRQPGRAGLGCLDVREEGRDRGRRLPLRRGRPAGRDRRGRRGRPPLDGDVWEIVTAPTELPAVREALAAGRRDRVRRARAAAHHAHAGRGGPRRDPDAVDRGARGVGRRAGRARQLRRRLRRAGAGGGGLTDAGRRARIGTALFWIVGAPCTS